MKSIQELKVKIENLKRSCDLVALVERSGTELKQHGHEWRGCCPIHQGNNPTSFVIRTGEQGQYWNCYAGCGSGDVIDFVMKVYHLDFKDALARLGVMDLPKPDPDRAVIKKEPNDPPPRFWQVRAWRVIERAEAVLWSEDGAMARGYLHKRGLTDETIRFWRLGLIPNSCYDNPKLWGLEGKEIWLPKGIVIPCFHGETVWYINIRRPEGDPKYYKVRGGKHAIFGVTQYHPVIAFTEGEFDTMLLHQETGDLVDVATAGAVRFLPKGDWLIPLLSKRHILAIVDNDPEGLKAIERWREFSQRVKVVKPLKGKDATEFHQAGGDLRAWIRFHLGQVDGKSPIILDQAISKALVDSGAIDPGQVQQTRRITLSIADMLDYLEENGLEIEAIDWSTSPPVVKPRPKTNE